MDPDFVSDSFREYFEMVFADTAELREAAFRLRYQVYCKELNYEDPVHFPSELEQDRFDPLSLQCLLRHRSSDQLVGTVRLVRVDPEAIHKPLPFEIACRGNLHADIMHEEALDRRKIGEISRLAVISHFRRRAAEKDTPGPWPDIGPNIDNERRVFPHLALGLYLAGASMGLLAGLEVAFVMMEPRLARRLKRYGILFEKVGDDIDFRGVRAPYRITRERLFAHIPPAVKSLMDVVIADLSRSSYWGKAGD